MDETPSDASCKIPRCVYANVDFKHHDLTHVVCFATRHFASPHDTLHRHVSYDGDMCLLHQHVVSYYQSVMFFSFTHRVRYPTHHVSLLLAYILYNKTLYFHNNKLLFHYLLENTFLDNTHGIHQVLH